MDFLFCRRFRRLWRSSTPSTKSHSHELSEPEPLFFPDDHPTGISSATEYAIVTESPRDSSGGLSERVRKRLSRESRRSNAVSGRSDRRSGTSLFSISSKPGKCSTAFIIPHELGSGLMSERGYDSDAQFISTPTHVTERAKTAAFVGRGVPPGQFYRNVEVSSSTEDEQYPGREEKKKYEKLVRSPEHEGWSPQALHGFFVSHDPKVKSPKATDGSPHSRRVNSETVRDKGETLVSMVSASSASFDMLGENDNPSQVATPKQQSGSPCFAPLRGLISPSTGPSSEIFVTKRRQPPSVSASEGRSIHLADMNISQILASQSTSPRLLSPNQSDGPHSPTRVLTPVWDAGVLKLEVHHANEASSCYSPRTSCTSADVTSNQSASKRKADVGSKKTEGKRRKRTFRAFSLNASSRRIPRPKVDIPAVNGGATRKPDALKSRFIEQFDLDQPMASPGSKSCNIMGSGMVSPRKVSIGWMSGGRRLGYGYTLVPEDEAKDTDKQSSKTSRTRGESMTSTSISSIMDRLNLRRWSGATAFLRSSNVSDSASCDSAKSSSLLRFASRRKDQNDFQMSNGRRALWSPGSGNGSAEVLGGHHMPEKNECTLDGTTQATSTGYQKRLQSAIGLRARQRSVKHKDHQSPTKMTMLSGRYTIGKKKGSRILKITRRKDRRDSSSDNVLMFPIKPSAMEPTSHSASREDTACSTKAGVFDLPSPATCRSEEDYQDSLERTASETITDDWVSMYLDCLEIHSDPE